jgi:hypothetical protein
MRKLLTLMLAVLLVGLMAAVVYAAVGAGDDSSVSTTETSPTTETTGTTTTEDRPAHRHRGHRHRHPLHHRHRHVTAPASGVDVSGPCDEAEHAGDPRCATGQGVVEDNTVRGQVDRHQSVDDNNQVDDRGGRGEVENLGDDHGGDNHGGDDLQGRDDDNSGPGHGGDDGQDNSGHGGGGHD